MKPFRLDDPQFNMNSYFGRVRHFFNVFNPMYVEISSNSHFIYFKYKIELL